MCFAWLKEKRAVLLGPNLSPEIQPSLSYLGLCFGKSWLSSEGGILAAPAATLFEEAEKMES